ncbi:MAG TPA: hypothetical protein VGR91_14305 [Stellaceae bacterium]|nr:hypothetical protein [Stellaceae bacterium]
MADELPVELAYALKIWWDPIWTILDRAGLAQQPQILAAAIDAQAQIHTIQANLLNQLKQQVARAQP